MTKRLNSKQTPPKLKQITDADFMRSIEDFTQTLKVPETYVPFPGDFTVHQSGILLWGFNPVTNEVEHLRFGPQLWLRLNDSEYGLVWLGDPDDGQMDPVVQAAIDFFVAQGDNWSPLPEALTHKLRKQITHVAPRGLLIGTKDRPKEAAALLNALGVLRMQQKIKELFKQLLVQAAATVENSISKIPKEPFYATGTTPSRSESADICLGHPPTNSTGNAENNRRLRM